MPDRAVIFDLDGTLAETAPDLMAATNFILAENGRPPISAGQVRAFVGMARALIACGFEASGDPVPAETMEPLYARFVEFYGANIAVGSSLFPGVRELLERCRAEGLALGVCTNKLEGFGSAARSARCRAIISARSSGRTRSVSPSLIRHPIARLCAAWAERIYARSWSATAKQISKRPVQQAFRQSA